MAESPEARRRILLGHLAGRLGLPEADIALERDPNGKPFLAHPARPFWFNTSSCDGLMAVASSPRGPVGVDIETVQRCAPVWRDASREFSSGEQALLRRLGPEFQPLAFACLWTAKEAVLKARGLGIVQGLALPDLSLGVDMAAPPPWPATKVNVGGDCYAVTWYMVPFDEATAVIARADSSPSPGMT